MNFTSEELEVMRRLWTENPDLARECLQVQGPLGWLAAKAYPR